MKNMKKAWLLQVTHHLCLDFFRFRKRHSYLELGEIEELIAGPEDENILRELFALPAQQKSILVLYYLEGYRIKEISGITGLSENAVKKRLQRGREALRAKLTE